MPLWPSLFLFLIVPITEGFLRIPLLVQRDESYGDNLKSFIDSTNLYLEGSSLPTVNLNKNSYQYYGEVKVGTPGQKINVVFHTAFNTLLVPVAGSPGTCSRNHSTYNYLSSSSYYSAGADIRNGVPPPYTILHPARDTVEIGGMVLTNQSLGIIIDGNCEGLVYDGVLGLGFPVSTQEQTVVSRLFNDHKVPQNVVGLYLNRDYSKKKGGEIAIGGIDETKIVKNSITYIDASKSTMWELNAASINIGTKQVASNVAVILDTSVSYIGFPRALLNAMRNATGATLFNDTLLVDKQTVKNLPSLTFNFSGKDYSLNGFDYVDTVNEHKSLSPVLLVPLNQSEWVIGNAFIGKYYTILDYQTRKIAFATINGQGVSQGNFIGIPLKKHVDESVARILQAAVISGSLNENTTAKSFVYNINLTQTLADKFQNDRYIQHYATIEVGIPGQKFDVTFNPVTSLTLIPSYRLKKSCGGRFRAYDENSSHTYYALGETITSDEGKVAVNVVRDIFRTGKLNVSDQTFGLLMVGECEEEDGSWTDGVIGLGFSMNYQTLLDNMLRQKIVNQSLVGLYLDRNIKTTQGGEIAFGHWNTKYMSNLTSIEYIPIIASTSPAWQLRIKNAFIGDSQVTFDRFAVIDTRSYFIDLPWFEAEIIAHNIGAYNFKGNFIVKCSNVSNLPNLTIRMGHREFNLTGRDYIEHSNSFKGYCTALIRSTTDNVWTLGGAFLAKYYTIFNYESRMIAFTELKSSAHRLEVTLLMWISPILLALIHKISRE